MSLRRPLVLSLSTRIFLAFAVVVAAGGAATTYGMAAVATLRHELGFLRQHALPLLDELRRSALELRGFDEALQRAAPGDLEWVVRFVPNARPYRRIDEILAHTRALRAGSEPPRLARLVTARRLPLPVLDERLAALRSSHQARDRMAQDAELLAAAGDLSGVTTDAAAFDRLVQGLQGAIADRRQGDAARLVVEIRRLIRHVHVALEASERAFEKLLTERFEEAERAEANLGVLVATASGLALAISVLMLLLTLATVRPVTALTEVVRRFAAGERRTRAATAGAAEIATLAQEWNRMADALAEREAQLGAQREDLARAERLAALGQLAARMAHEVRNPLSSIGLNAELLDEELRRGPAIDTAEAQGLVAAIGAEVERLREITEGYLDRARPVPGQQGPVLLGDLVTSLHDFVRSELERRGVAGHLKVESEVWVEADPAQVRQALWNLLRNAWEAMPEGGSLWLEVTARPGEQGPVAVVAVEDSGPGVPDERKDAIFHAFFTTKERGTGLGLAVVAEIARSHRGRVRLVAGRHGSGARFELELPRTDRRRSEAA